jgi:hypothetical protein
MFKNYGKSIAKIFTLGAIFGVGVLGFVLPGENPKTIAGGKFSVVAATPPPAPSAAAFNQSEALAKLREQIKGREREPAGKVFKNVQMNREIPAGRFLMMMEMGYARSLGVDCTHCHTPDKWEAEDKNAKQIAREMAAMTVTLNGQTLKNIKNLKSPNPTINCTTCHRGEIKPAVNLPTPGKTD